MIIVITTYLYMHILLKANPPPPLFSCVSLKPLPIKLLECIRSRSLYNYMYMHNQMYKIYMYMHFRADFLTIMVFENEKKMSDANQSKVVRAGLNNHLVFQLKIYCIQCNITLTKLFKTILMLQPSFDKTFEYLKNQQK